ncbi:MULTISPECIES: glycosyltransferase family 4 protein [Microbacterium]|uniref:glycosyltransferase family 4 protein n=1 Tax=Microbacterium TaxID=33882 RepID=UPI00344F83D9
MTDLLRVAHLGHALEPGGAELALRRILVVSPGRWRARLVLSGQGEDAGVFNGLPSDVEIIRSGVAQPPGATDAGPLGAVAVAVRLVQEALAYRRLRALHDVDVVHANTSRSAIVGALALIGRRVPFVVHLRDRIDRPSLGTFGFYAFKLLVSRKASVYIANSESTASSARGGSKGRPIFVLASPIGVERAQPRSLSSAPTLRIGMVARLDAWKGQDLLIEAYRVSRVSDRASLTFFGDAAFGKQAYARQLTELVTSSGLTDVTFAGFVDDVSAAIDSLDVCVQYSTRPEPLGQNVLQYLARGKTTVVADEGGPTEWVDHEKNGIRVPPRDVDALAAALDRVISDPVLRSRLGEAARKTPHLPTDQAAADAHLQAFRDAADEGARR